MYIHIYIYMFVYMFIYIYIYVYIYILFIHIQIYFHVYDYIYTNILAHLYIQIYEHIYFYTYLSSCTRTHFHTLTQVAQFADFVLLLFLQPFSDKQTSAIQTTAALTNLLSFSALGMSYFTFMGHIIQMSHVLL